MIRAFYYLSNVLVPSLVGGFIIYHFSVEWGLESPLFWGVGMGFIIFAFMVMITLRKVKEDE